MAADNSPDQARQAAAKTLADDAAPTADRVRHSAHGPAPAQRAQGVVGWRPGCSACAARRARLNQLGAKAAQVLSALRKRV